MTVHTLFKCHPLSGSARFKLNGLFLAFRGVVLICCLSVLGIFTGCAGVHKAGGADERSQPQPAGIKGPIRLELKLVPNRIEKTKLESVVLTQRFEKGQLLNERSETTDFAIKTTHVSSQGPTGPFLYTVKTISKDGMAELHDLAFPELSESLDLQITPQGDVVSAGHYPKDSIFYIPSLSLPTRLVEVGDTWALKREWHSLKGGLPMEFDIVSVFRNAFACGKSVCAEIEISGVVTMQASSPAEAKQNPTSLQSDIKGRYLFDIQTGTVLWSDIRNSEQLLSGEWKVLVRSCLVESLEEPISEHWPWFKQVKCDPMQEVASKVPGLP